MKITILTALFILFTIHQLTIFTTSADDTQRYAPTDNIALDCGSPDKGTSLDSRPWLADTNSPLFTLQDQIPNTNKSVMSTTVPNGLPVDKVPYLTARISRTQFTYTFTVSPGQKFIRLHFFSSTYSEFETSRAFFSVKTGSGFTLLSNFTALDADSGKYTITREFCVDVAEGSSSLNLTFIPGPEIPDSYAFVNGIEIVSMPTDLYYTNESLSLVPLQIVGSGSPFSIRSDTALQLMYRINVGGNAISAIGDTGMFREWSYGDVFLTDARPGPVLTDPDGTLNYSKIPSYTAPDLVYQTYVSMGNNTRVNENYNLTWTFVVDSGFSYLVRLHFCEFMPVFQTPNDKAFQIFIADQVAENNFDITFSGGNSVPIYRDYIALIGSTRDNIRNQNLTIKLHPVKAITRYKDASLNGVEIFKVSSNSGDLAGFNPELPPPRPGEHGPRSPDSTTSGNSMKFGIIGGVVGGIIVAFVFGFFIFRRKLVTKDSSSSADGAYSSWWNSFASHTGKSVSTNKSYASSLPSDLCRHFSLSEIKLATNNFDETLLIGVGGFGNVYRGYFNEGASYVAIKRLNPGSQQGVHEFRTEIEMLSQLRHIHLVSLIGYCYDEGEMILVYDYMAHGTLRDHLYKTDNPPLDWNQRLQICIGAARGLQYLHSGAKQTIIHRDVKTTNILLDEKWVAKVSDFGLSKIGPNSESKLHVSTAVKGSVGYLDPEYYRSQQLTEKSDVYSFGVVLCEIISARPPVNRLNPKKPVSLAEWARQCYRKTGTLTDIIDPYLNGKIAPECLSKFSEVAVSCLRDYGYERPSMSDIVWSLEFTLQLQQSADEKRSASQSEIDTVKEDLLKDSSNADSSVGSYIFSSTTGSGIMVDSRISGITITSSSGEHSLLNTNDDTTKNMTSGAVFSEIMNPRAR